MKRKEKILIVDDDKNQNELITAPLELEGYEVSIAISGREAIEKMRQINPAIVLLDLKLPDMDGIEVLGNIKANKEDLIKLPQPYDQLVLSCLSLLSEI